MALQNTNGDFVLGQGAISEVAVEYFKQSVGIESPVQSENFQDLDFLMLNDAQANTLEQPINSDIIFKTLKSIKRNKAPGPDGFTVEFFLAC